MLRDQKLLPAAGCCMLACGAGRAALGLAGAILGLAGAALGFVAVVVLGAVALGAVAWVLGVVLEGVVVVVLVCACARPIKPAAAASAMTAVSERCIPFPP